MFHRRTSFFTSTLLLFPLAGSIVASASAATVTGSATASASASAKVGRSSGWQSGKSVSVRKSGQARFRGRTRAELTLHKKGLTAIQLSKKTRLTAATRAKIAAQTQWKAKVQLRVAAESKLSAALKSLEKAKATLKAKMEARASAEVELKSAKDDRAALEAKAKGSISIDISFGANKKKADARVKTADTKVKKAKDDEAKAKKAVDDAEVAHDKATHDVTTTKKDESTAASEVTKTEKEETVAEDDVKDANQDVADVDQELAQPTPPDNEPVVIADPPATPPDNAFGYEQPVWGCFEGNVMFIEPNSPKLPTDYSKYQVASRLYACEWDVPQRAFEDGFPGVTGQFEWFAIVYSGMFNVSQAGTYQFRINSDDGTKLTIDGTPVVLNDGQHAPASVSGSINLTAGDHEMVLEYFQGPRYLIALQVWVTPPGGTEQIFTVR
jgi:hypothetical protein